MRAASLSADRRTTRRPAQQPHRSRRAALDPFLIEEATLTRDELLRARAADHFWDSAAPDAA